MPKPKRKPVAKINVVAEIMERRQKAKKPRPRGPKELPAPDIMLDFKQVSALSRRSAYAADTTLCKRDRILNAIHWMVSNIPDKFVDMAIFHWLCGYAGKYPRKNDHQEIKKFTESVRRMAVIVEEAYEPCWLLIERGRMCLVTDRTLIATFVGTAVIRREKSAGKFADRWAKQAGDPSKWKVTDKNRDFLEPLRKQYALLQRVATEAGRLQLPAAPSPRNAEEAA